MRILHVTTHWTGGGSERNVKHHLECLVRAGHEVELAVGSDQRPDLLPFPEGVRVLTVPGLRRAPHPRYDALATQQLRATIGRGWDVVHTHLSKAGLVARLAAPRGAATVIHTVHGPQLLSNPLYRAAERAALRGTRATVFVGNELRERYLDAFGGRAAKSVVIRSPVEVESFRALRPPATGDAVTALVATRLVPGKRLDLLPAILAATPTSVRVLVAGDGPLCGELERKRISLGLGDRLQLLGYFDRVEDALTRASLVLSLSSVEGLPQVVVQAIAARRPVVAVPALGVREVVQHGTNGVLIEGDIVDGAAAALTRLADDPSLFARLVEACGNADLGEWRPEKICARQLELLRELTLPR